MVFYVFKNTKYSLNEKKNIQFKFIIYKLVLSNWFTIANRLLGFKFITFH